MALVKPGLAKKLAQLWHGPCRIVDEKGEFMAKLNMGTEYQCFPWVHTSWLKLRTEFPERQTADAGIATAEDGLEDSWEADEGAGKYSVDAVRDVGCDKPTRTSQ